MDDLTGIDFLSGLRALLEDRFSVEDVRTLCFELKEDYDSLPGDGVKGKIRELILYFQRRRRISDLITASKRLRPDITNEIDRLYEDTLFVFGGYADDETMYQYMAQRYGVGYGDLSVEWRLAPDGSAKVRREVIVEAYSVIDQLDTFLRVIEEDPTGQVARKVGYKEVSSLTPGRRVVMTNTLPKDRALSLVIAISPPLKDGEKCSYELREQLPVGLYAVNEETRLRRATEYDYCGWTINRPTRNLCLRVCFPSNIEVTPYDYSTVVRYASVAPGLPTKHQHLQEQKRVQTPSVTTEDDQFVLSLEVEYPMIGLVYILQWQPIPRFTQT